MVCTNIDTFHFGKVMFDLKNEAGIIFKASDSRSALSVL